MHNIARSIVILDEVQTVPRELVKTNNDPNIIIAEGANLKKLNRDLIELKSLSQMHPESMGNKDVDYAAPPLPKNTFDYPREDLMKQILSLHDLKKPIKIDNKELDEINKELYDQAVKEKKPGNFVQILTNKPRSVYYVAVITRQPHAEMFLFAAMSVRNAGYPQQFFQSQDHFVQRAQQQFAKTYRENVIAHLQKTLGYSGISEEARKSFDERGGGE